MSDKATQESSTGSDSDQDFDPTADMLVNDFDDEHTLAEEEALEDSNSDEIDDLQRESEMPIEELLALYRSNMPDNVTSTVDDEELEQSEADEKKDEQKELSSNLESTTSQSEVNDKQPKPEGEYELIAKPLPASSNLSRLISTSEDAFFEVSDDEEEDEEDTPEDNYRRTIQVGLDYQAAIPDSTVKEDLNVVNNSLLLWNPKQIDELDVEKYLRSFTADLTNQLDHRDELALYVLLQNNYEIDNALNSRNNLDKEQIDLFTFIKPWSDEECDLFEEGLRVHGKDFHQVQKNKLPNKTVNELVNFYYLWKKTERHDTFTSKFRFEKKKYSLNPMTTDLMDHFLDDQQQQQQTNQSFNSTSSSLNNSQNNTVVHKQSSTSPLTLLPQAADQSTVNFVTTTNHLADHSNLNETNTSTDLKSDLSISNNLSNEDSSSNQSSSLVINEINEINSNEDDSCLTNSTISVAKATSLTDTTDCVESTISESTTTNLADVTSSES